MPVVPSRCCSDERRRTDVSVDLSLAVAVIASRSIRCRAVAADDK
jgi:hypothetical protein